MHSLMNTFMTSDVVALLIQIISNKYIAQLNIVKSSNVFVSFWILLLRSFWAYISPSPQLSLVVLCSVISIMFSLCLSCLAYST